MSDQINPRVYSFYDVAACNMCGTPTQSARVVGFRLDRQTGRDPRRTQGVGVSVLGCSHCGLHFSNPQPRPHALSDHYGVPPEAYWKESAFRPSPGYFRRQIETAKSLLGGDRPIRALDVGVGLGKAVTAMQAAGMNVWGIEPSEPFHKRALENTGLPADRLKLASIEDAEFPEGSFDFVTFGAVLEHVYDPAAAIERSIKWLRPGGVWHAEVPSADHLVPKIINAYYRVRGTNYVTNLSPMHSPYHIHEFTLASFAKHAARNSGFEIATHHYDVCSIFHLPGVLHPLLRYIMQRTDTGMQLTVWLRRTV